MTAVRTSAPLTHSPDSDSDEVQLQILDGIAVLTLNRPQVLNAWTQRTRDLLLHQLAEVAARVETGEVTAVVLTGHGDRAFCAGQDLNETAQFNTSQQAQAWIDSFEELYATVRGFDCPVLAAINGVAAGSGFQLALLADIRIGHPGVRMGQPEGRSGIRSITGIWAMSQVLTLDRCRELALTGRLLDGEEAVQLGLLHQLVDADQVLPATLRYASELAALPTGAFVGTKQRVRELSEDGFRDAFACARAVHADAFADGEPQSQMRRFLEGRS